MAREVTYRCKGPDCEIFVQSATPAPPRAWIVVREREGEAVTELDFCGWSCVLKFAGRIEPEEVIDV
jgi:hypothetical protein